MDACRLQRGHDTAAAPSLFADQPWIRHQVSPPVLATADRPFLVPVVRTNLESWIENDEFSVGMK